MALSVFEKEISWGSFFAALSKLEHTPRKTGRYVCTMSDFQWSILWKSACREALLTRNSPKETMSGHYVGTVGPVDIYTTTDQPDGLGKMWQREARDVDKPETGGSMNEIIKRFSRGTIVIIAALIGAGLLCVICMIASGGQ